MLADNNFSKARQTAGFLIWTLLCAASDLLFMTIQNYFGKKKKSSLGVAFYSQLTIGRVHRYKPILSLCYHKHTPVIFWLTFWTQLTYHFNGRTAQPLERTAAPGCDKPTSRCQTFPSMWTLGEDQPVIPRVTFIRWATALPHGTVGSLRPAFAPARLVGLTVKLSFAFALNVWFPSRLREPLHASVTL